jgi:hypothetical protein
VTDNELRESVRKRLKARNNFFVMAAIFAIVAVILALIWFMSSGPGSYFWPVWPYLGMGIALTFAALDAFGIANRTITEADIDAELARRNRRNSPPA